MSRQSHTVSMLKDHMVFCPKFRTGVLDGRVARRTDAIIRQICKRMGIEVIRLAVGDEHVHLYIEYPPKYSLSRIAGTIKGQSSRMLRKEFPELREMYPDGLWSRSSFHGSVGHGSEVVERYIEEQKKF